MKCKNTYCTWNAFGQCCPEDAQQYNNAIPNTLDCPSSLRVDFETQLLTLANECKSLMDFRDMQELIQIKKFIESQRRKNHVR